MQAQNQELVNKYYTRGVAYSEKGRIELAIKDYTQAIELNPMVKRQKSASSV